MQCGLGAKYRIDMCAGENNRMKQDEKPLVLVVDDTPENLRLLKAVLGSASYRVELAASGPQALEVARTVAPDLILLDVLMPGMDGYAVCVELKANEATRDIPVIFVTGMHDVDDQAKGFELGAVDYITKPISIPLVLARVRAHLALYGQRRSLEGMFRDVVEFAPDAFVLSDESGRIVQINAQAEKLFGYAREELIGQPVDLLIPQALAHGHEDAAKGQAPSNDSQPVNASVRCLRKDASAFPAEINRSPLQTHHGRLLMAVVRDVSERQRQEDQLREAARYARSLIEATLDPLVMIDTHGVITDVNVACERITGLTREQLIGSEAASKFTEPERLYQGFQQVVGQGQIMDFPMAIRHTSGKVTDVLCNASVYRNAKGVVIGVFASARDVTESRRIQEEIRSSRQRLRELAAQSEAVREDEKKHIAREVHDELGQVLTALRMDLSMLGMQSASLAPALKDRIYEMKALVDRAIQGVRNVAGNLRPAALDMGLVAAVEWLCVEFNRHTGTPCAFEPDQISVDLDETRAVVIFRMVQESLTNITRYAQASQVHIAMARQDNVLRLEIRDDGRGFDPAAAAKKKSYGLLGMNERAIALGGKVDIISAVGQGTRIVVNIPLEPGNAEKEMT
jgi:PAS domain S-box-containing protein